MYGLMFEMLRKYIEDTFGASIWSACLEIASGKKIQFMTRHNYPADLLKKLITSLCDIIGLPEDEICYDFGYSAPTFMKINGYESLLKILGANFIDFILNIDELHQYLRLSYPLMKIPGFLMHSMNGNLIELTYSSVRDHFPDFVRGQLTCFAKSFYELDITIKLVQNYKKNGRYYFKYHVYNKGKPWTEIIRRSSRQLQQTTSLDLSICVSENTFFDLLPFHLVITNDLMIKRAGKAMLLLKKDLINSSFKQYFKIIKPKIEYQFDEICENHYTTFELSMLTDKKGSSSKSKRKGKEPNTCRFKGEMVCVNRWNMILFLGSPIIKDAKELSEQNLFISDMNMYDQSQDIIHQGGQMSDELMKLFEKQHEKSKQMEKSMQHLEKVRKTTDELLYQCIPRSVARKIRNGTPAIETISTYEECTICFTKVVNFGAKCMKISVEQVIDLLNRMYTLYDSLTEKYKVYKVETISDSYMIVSGVPIRTSLHAAHIIDLALEILRTTQQKLYWPEILANIPANKKGQLIYSDEHLQLFIGCHSGPIVAGVVGFKSPRYCLFGDTVNTSSRMMSHSLPGHIHISKSCEQFLSAYPYKIESRGEIPVKGKGMMETFFVKSRQEDFNLTDSTDGIVRNFEDILKADLANDETTPSEVSEEEFPEIEFDLSEDEAEMEDSWDAPVQTTEEQINDKPLKSPQNSKSSSLEQNKSNNSDKNQNNDNNNNNNKDTDDNINYNDDDNNNNDTTNILNQAARRLMETKIIEVQNDKKKRQPYTFKLDEPDEIVNTSDKENNNTKTDQNYETNSMSKSTQSLTDNNTKKVPERTRLIKTNTQIRTDRSSSSSRLEKSSGNSMKQIEEDKILDSNVENFRQMVKQNGFDPLPVVPFCSPQAVIFRDLASQFFKKMDKNFTLFWEENKKKFRDLGC